MLTELPARRRILAAKEFVLWTVSRLAEIVAQEKLKWRIFFAQETVDSRRSDFQGTGFAKFGLKETPMSRPKERDDEDLHEDIQHAYRCQVWLFIIYREERRLLKLALP